MAQFNAYITVPMFRATFEHGIISMVLILPISPFAKGLMSICEQCLTRRKEALSI